MKLTLTASLALTLTVFATFPVALVALPLALEGAFRELTALADMRARGSLGCHWSLLS
jgi:hypothetical protein